MRKTNGFDILAFFIGFVFFTLPVFLFLGAIVLRCGKNLLGPEVWLIIVLMPTTVIGIIAGIRMGRNKMYKYDDDSQ